MLSYYYIFPRIGILNPRCLLLRTSLPKSPLSLLSFPLISFPFHLLYMPCGRTSLHFADRFSAFVSLTVGKSNTAVFVQSIAPHFFNSRSCEVDLGGAYKFSPPLFCSRVTVSVAHFFCPKKKGNPLVGFPRNAPHSYAPS